jgi:hypothetical protein
VEGEVSLAERRAASCEEDAMRAPACRSMFADDFKVPLLISNRAKLGLVGSSFLKPGSGRRWQRSWLTRARLLWFAGEKADVALAGEQYAQIGSFIVRGVLFQLPDFG